jgi:HTH-type transcriptional regulator, cell division transcriptional repressor
MKTYWYNNSKNIVGRRVRLARKRMKEPVTQQDLSARLGVMGINIDRVSISKIESGQRFVADFEIVALADALNVTLEWLLRGDPK